MLYVLYYTNGRVCGTIKHANYNNYKFWLDMLKIKGFYVETKLEFSNIITPDENQNRGDLLRKVLRGAF